MRALLAFAFVLMALLAPRPAHAHGMRTAYVELHEEAGGHVRVLVRSGTTYGSVQVVPPEGCTATGGDRWSCTRPLRGAAVRLEGLGGTVSDAVIVALPLDGGAPTALLRAGAASWTVPPREDLGPTLVAYLRAGFVHVFGGADHLLFLAALVVVLRRFRAVLLAETAFTVSHSVAFTASALGVVHVPSAAAEAAIALSLVLVAQGSRRGPMAPARGATMAFVFGAVHGLGFAGGLAELGLPREAVASALAGFALGVELAQVVFLAGCFVVVRAATHLAIQRRLFAVTAYGVGIVGVFWFLERALPILRRALS